MQYLVWFFCLYIDETWLCWNRKLHIYICFIFSTQTATHLGILLHKILLSATLFCPSCQGLKLHGLDFIIIVTIIIMFGTSWSLQRNILKVCEMDNINMGHKIKRKKYFCVYMNSADRNSCLCVFLDRNCHSH